MEAVAPVSQRTVQYMSISEKGLTIHRGRHRQEGPGQENVAGSGPVHVSGESVLKFGWDGTALV